MNPYVANLRELDRTMVTRAGGKAANLGELFRVEGVQVPEGFCVTTSAWQRVMAQTPAIDASIEQLEQLGADADGVARVAGELRATIADIPVPAEVADAITRALDREGAAGAYAVRSSATAEDAPTASFAGQQDSYLNIVGEEAILRHVRLCWASLFTDRAVAYRSQHGFAHHEARMAVVVQRMVLADAAGVLFTADPVSGDRTICSVEAVPGLGDSLVSGRESPDVYKVWDDRVLVRAAHVRPVLSDVDARQLAALGRRIEAHLGAPQDIEWCRVGDAFHVVQARPITTLFPAPETGEPGNRVFMSVGHSQMMTDAMKPLGLSIWQLTTPRPMYVAGGRLFVDVTRELAAPAIRAGFLAMVTRSDPLTGRALRAIVDREGFLPVADLPPGVPPSAALRPSDPIDTDPTLVSGLIRETLASIEALEVRIQTRSGVDLLDFVLEDLAELQRLLRQSHQAAMAGMEATWWLNDKLQVWLGEKNPADTLTLSAPNNITSEMGLDLLRLADTIRPRPMVVRLLEQAEDGSFLDALPDVPGGAEARDALLAFLDTYGARCAGEIDITRPRWSEQPAALLPTLLNNVRNAEEGAAERLVERGVRAAARKEAEILGRLAALPDGEARAEETRGMIRRLQTFIGFREFPKYGMIRRYFVYKRALLAEAGRLVQAGVLREPDDIFFLTFEELRSAAAGNAPGVELVDQRRRAHTRDARLAPPRVITSDGEILTAAYDRESIPDGALVGLPVSSGVVEGRARVVLDLAAAVLEPGDILVTRFTDPSWTPVFFGIAGLVTEVGGQMTHGSVVAREYGLPAVVAVENATRAIRDGQRIRVDGTDGYVEILESSVGG
ncbi:MAG: phosphoenolpyruvate synthase [Alphaproteobacteria bacterium]|nr:phosphoenolpyruvate synthase [Alphaproteobacteria bacterium]